MAPLAEATLRQGQFDRLTGKSADIAEVAQSSVGANSHPHRAASIKNLHHLLGHHRVGPYGVKTYGLWVNGIEQLSLETGALHNAQSAKAAGLVALMCFGLSIFAGYAAFHTVSKNEG